MLRNETNFAIRTLALCKRQLGGHKFRRQHPFDRYVVDFVCLKRRLVVEVDGSVHDEPEQQRKDRVRQAWPERRGYRVLRVRNDELGDDIAPVLARISEALGR